MNTLVSAIITTYNSELSIERTLQSIINQTYSNIEVLIYDDNSTDQTLHIAKRVLEDFSIQYEICKSEKNNGGPAIGRNWGISKANGKYICFCDADDEWLPRKLETQITFLETSSFDFCGTQCNVIGSTPFKPHDGIITIWSQIKRNKFPLSTLMMESKSLKAHNIMFDERKDYHGVEDFNLILSCYAAGQKGYVLSDYLVNYYYLSDSLSHQNIGKSERRRLLVLENYEHKNVWVMLYKKIIIMLLKTRLLANGI